MIGYLLKHNYGVWFENEESSDKEELADKKGSIDLAGKRRKMIKTFNSKQTIN